ncbi:MAG: HAMP domain-containing protein [Nitrospirae bacterium]|nr:HAMP domain-containing protein [Nitrospirota bacterium]
MAELKTGLGVRSKILLIFIVVISLASILVFAYHLLKIQKNTQETNLKKGTIVVSTTSSNLTSALASSAELPLTEIVKKTLAMDKDFAYCVIQDDKGSVLAHTFPKDVPKVLETLKAPTEGISTNKWEDPRGNLILDIAAPAGKGRIIRLGIKEFTLLDALNAEITDFLIAMAIIFSIIIPLSILVSGKITRPLVELIGATRALSKGDFSVTATVRSKDEFGALATAINNSIETLRAQTQTGAERKKTQEGLVYMLNIISSASEGDLSQKAPVTADLFGSIADAYNLMIEGLSELLNNVRMSTTKVGQESQKMLLMLREMGKGAETQMAEVKKATGNVDETINSIIDISEKTKTAQDISSETSGAAEKGDKLVTESIDGIQIIRVTVQSINKKMKNLSERLMEIETISKLISDVAFQTNLLALNASIEAARAGEQGKGFVIIAEQIRELADRSASATKQIGEVINAIQLVAGEVTTTLEEETRLVEHGTNIAKDTGDAFEDIKNAINNTSRIISEIYDTATNQKGLSAKVVIAMEEVNRISMQMLKMVKDSSSISESLSATSKGLLDAVGTFKLPGQPEISGKVSF